MFCFDDAKSLEAVELKGIIDRNANNPTVERLVFVEQRSLDGSIGRVFPCWLTAWGEEDSSSQLAGNSRRKSLIFRCVVVQSENGEFSMLPVTIRETELISQKRVWDKPPSDHCNMNALYSYSLLQ